MTQVCKHCDTELPPVRDAFCSNCHEPIEHDFDEQSANVNIGDVLKTISNTDGDLKSWFLNRNLVRASTTIGCLCVYGVVKFITPLIRDAYGDAGVEFAQYAMLTVFGVTLLGIVGFGWIEMLRGK